MAEFEEYYQNSNMYWGQSLESLNKGEFEKASEFAWGSVASRIKALALVKTGSRIRSHREIREFIKRLAYQARNVAMYRAYRDVEGLHSNFYECGMDPNDVRDIIMNTQELLFQIDRLIAAK